MGGMTVKKGGMKEVKNRRYTTDQEPGVGNSSGLKKKSVVLFRGGGVGMARENVNMRKFD